jgi:uncharacterized membrane protein YbhN (UPF0104 family)
VLLLIGGAVWTLRGQLPALRALVANTRPRWSLVALSMLAGLSTYALLIDNWRRVLRVMGGRIGYGAAAVIWLASSLARYLPLYGWQFATMTEMTRRRGVPIAVTTGAAIVITIVNLLTGYAVFAAASLTSPALHARGRWIILLGVVALAVAPFAAPRLARLARRMTGRELAMPVFGPRPVLVAVAYTTAAWVAYGVAFWMLTRALLDGPRPVVACIAVYTGSYLTGLVNPAPAGLGASDGAIVALVPAFGVGTPAEGALLAVAVRIWRTVLDVGPGVVALAFARQRPQD